jgi:hypothetical protein
LETSEAKTNHQEEVSAKQRQLEESDLLLNLYRTLIESADLSSGFCSALELVCGFTGWIVGTAWLPSADETQLELCHLGIEMIQSSPSSLGFASSNYFPATLAYRAGYGIGKNRNGRAI